MPSPRRTSWRPLLHAARHASTVGLELVHSGSMPTATWCGVLGLIEAAETEQEKADLQEFVKAYWENFHREGIQRFRDDLIARVSPIDLGNVSFLWMEAAVAKPLA